MKPRAYRDRIAEMEEKPEPLTPDPDEVLPGPAMFSPPAATVPEPVVAAAQTKPGRAKRDEFCEFCNAACRPVPSGSHRCQCMNEPTNPKPDHWSLDKDKRAAVIASLKSK